MPEQKTTTTILLKILKIVVIISLLPYPLIIAVDMLKKYSPYHDGNSVGTYVLVSILYGIVSTIAAYFVTNKTLPKQLMLGGALLLIIGISMTAVAGLPQPDFSVNVLKHPEREQLRYALLFLNALLFAGAFILIIKYHWKTLHVWHKAIVLLFIIAFAELIWEFQHHYFIAGYMQDWVNQGNKADDFMANFTPEIIFRFCGLARCILYATIAWLAFILLKNSRIKKWVFIVIAIFSVLGVVTGTGVLVFGYASFEKLKALLVLFIPAGPFCLLYWTGLAILSKKTATVKV